MWKMEFEVVRKKAGITSLLLGLLLLSLTAPLEVSLFSSIQGGHWSFHPLICLIIKREILLNRM